MGSTAGQLGLKLGAGCGVLGAVLLAGAAQAQDAAVSAPAPPLPAEADAAGAANLADIVVTARRTTERLQEVPVAVTAVTPAQVRTLNLADTRDLVRIAPALGFTQGSTTKLQNFIVRGVGTFVNSDGFDQSVGVAFDGVSLARPGGSIADLIDIERVEVLEGPQGMLFGRNASAGLINIISNKPQLDAASLAGRLSYGSYNELKVEAAANLPVGDSFAARLVGWESRHDGYVRRTSRDDRIGEKDSRGVRLRTLWAPSDRVRLNLMGEYIHADQDPAVATIRLFTTNAAGVRDYELAKGTQPAVGNDTTTSNVDLYNRNHSGALSAELQYDVGDPTITLLGSYRNIAVTDKFDPNATSSPIYLNDQVDRLKYHQSSGELRLNSGPRSKLKYVVGAIYFDLKLHDQFDISTSGGTPVPVSVSASANQTSRHYAFFGEFTYPLLRSVRLIAGARKSWDRISGDLTRNYLKPPAGIIPAFNGPGATFGPYAAASSVKDSEWSYRAGAQWDVVRDVMLYTTVSRGYKAAGLDLGFTTSASIFAANQLRVSPEISRNLEVGLRSQFLDRKVTLNVTAFNEIFSDFQISTRLPVPGTVFSIQNAKRLKSTGATVALDVRPARGLTLSSNAAYIHSRYTDFANAACYPGQAAAPAGTPLTPGLCVAGSQSLNGVPLLNSPKWRLIGTARYETPDLVRGFTTFAQANVRYQTYEELGTAANPIERQAAYAVVNLAAGFGPEHGRWNLSFYGNNIFNRRYVGRTVPQISGAYYTNIVSYEARARWGAALDVRF